MSGPSRRQALHLAGAALGGLALGAPAAAHRTTIEHDTLAANASVGGLVYGAAGGEGLIADRAFRDLFERQAAILTPENAMKFGSLQPQRGRFDFAPADTLVDGALRAGLLVHGHTLMWNDNQPAWLGALSHREISREFDAYLDTVVPHFAGRLQSWDVVNEPFWLGSDRPGTFRPGPWYDALGADYIFRAFARTAALDPGAKLVLNEAWTERSDHVGLAVRHALLGLIDRIKDKGLRLDAVGLQGHLLPQFPSDDAGFADFLHQIAERGVDIYITEFDIYDATYSEGEAARDAAVAARARAFLEAILPVPAVKMVITWGLSDRYTFMRDPGFMAANGLTRLARPLPYDDMLRKTPMWTAMAETFAGRDRGMR